MEELAHLRSPLIGRHDMLEELRTVWSRGRRVVSLVGPPGAGKTRLAFEAVANGRELFELPPHKIWTCTLSGVANDDDLVARISDELGVPPEMRAHGPLAALSRWLGTGSGGLIVLDNVEEAVDSVGSMLAALRRDAPTYGWLLTSRVALDTPDEQVLRVAPLAVPPEAVTRLSELLRYDAAALFVSLAGLGDRLGDDDAPVVARIVRQLEGLPLSLDLVARRLELLSLADVEQRLANRLELARDGARTGAPAPYHDALWMTLDWSWSMLESWQQAALAQLALFRGRFTLAMAESVVAVPHPPEPISGPTPTPLDALQGLVRHSMVEWRGQLDGDKHFFLLDTIRDFVLARIEWDGEAKGAAWQRYVNTVVEHGEAHRGTIHTEGGVEALAALRRLRADLRAVQTDASSPVYAARACAALGGLLLHNGERELHDELVGAALARLDGVVSTDAARARVLLHRDRARICRFTNRLEDGLTSATAALELAESLADQPLIVSARQTLADIFLQRNDGDGVAEQHAEIRRHAAQGVPCERELASLCSIAGILALDRDRAAGRALFEEGIRHAQTVGDDVRRASLLANLGNVALEENAVAEARAHFAQALEIFERYGEFRRIAVAKGLIGITDFASGMPNLRPRFEAIAADFHRVGDRLFEAYYTYFAALAYVGDTQLHQARESLEHSLAVLAELDTQVFAAVSRGVLAAITAVEGEVDRARTLAAEARAHLPGGRTESTPSLRLFELVIEVCGGTPFASIEAEFEAAHRADGCVGTRKAALTCIAMAERRAQIWNVAEDGSWFASPDGERVAMGRRRAPKRILAALALQRRDKPGQGLSREELFAIGWPGQNIDAESAANRVYVALSTLRKLGLEPLITHADNAYLLDPAQSVHTHPL